MAACLPEQFWVIDAGLFPAARQANAASSSVGRVGVLRRSASVSPAPARIRRTPSRWAGSPEWLAQASASSSPSRSSPARTMATACTGFSEERG